MCIRDRRCTVPVVTIARIAQRGGRAVAETVAASLGYPCIGREILTDAAVNLGVSPELLGTALDRVPGIWDRVTAQRRGYLVALQAALSEHVAKGDLVYHSYAGHLLLRGVPAVLRLRIIAPQEQVAGVAVVDEVAFRHVLRQRGLQGDQVAAALGRHAIPNTRDPVERRSEEFRRHPEVHGGIGEDLASDARIAQRGGHRLRNRPAAGHRASRDGDDGHGAPPFLSRWTL